MNKWKGTEKEEHFMKILIVEDQERDGGSSCETTA